MTIEDKGERGGGEGGGGRAEGGEGGDRWNESE